MPSSPRPILTSSVIAIVCGTAVAWSAWCRAVAGGPATRPSWVGFAVTAVILAVALALLLVRFIGPRLRAQPKGLRRATVLLSLAAGTWLTIAIPVPPPPAPPAPHELEIIALGERHPAAHASEVWVLGLFGPDGVRQPDDAFAHAGTWVPREGALLSYHDQPDTLTWRGRLTGDATLRLITHPWSGRVRITWDGQSQELDLYAPASTSCELRLSSQPDQTIAARVVRELGRAADSLTLGLTLLFISAGLLARRSWPTPAPGRCATLRYAAPCAAVWTVNLVAYWPALMSPDSVHQWHQVVTGQFSDWHPAIHTLTNWLLTRIWLSPAAVALVQVLVGSLVVGLVLSRLRGLGLPRWLAVVLALVCALTPANGVLMITLWKDVPFSIAMLGFTLLLVQIVASNGAWLARPHRWLVLGLVAAAASLYRHNGFPIAVATLTLSALLGRRTWRHLAASLGLMIVLVLGVRGPLYQALRVTPASVAGWVWPCWHHIGAHVAAGTALREGDRELLHRIRPDGIWHYRPDCVDPLVFDGHTDNRLLQEHRYEVAALSARLAWHRPRVLFRHIASVGVLAWRLAVPPGTYFGTHVVALPEGQLHGIAPNSSGLASDPPWPGLTRRMATWLQWSGENRVSLALLWRPATYLYLAVAGTLIAAGRARRAQWLLVLVPVGLNTLLIALIAPGQDFRFLYSTFLVGLLIGPYLLWTAGRAAPKP